VPPIIEIENKIKRKKGEEKGVERSGNSNELIGLSAVIVEFSQAKH
jgi:hypothetical protein